MSDQEEQGEHLSVKGQMAARYRERQSMAFSLASCIKGDGDDTTARASVAATVSDVPSVLARHKIFRSTDQAVATSDPLAGISRNVATAGLPMTARSKSSLGEIQTKPTMKDLITKFETRVFACTQLRQSTETAGEKPRMARDAWGSSCPRIKMELDPSAMTSSSSSDVVDSKSSASLSKPPHAKTSRGTLSLNYDTNSRLQMLQSLNRPLSCSGVSNTPEQLSVEDLLNVTNSHRVTDNQSMNTVSQSQADNAEEVPAAKEEMSNIACVSSNTETVHDKTGKIGKEPKQNADVQGVPAVRVNLREYAQKRKIPSDNKYVVHTKNWGKRHQKKDTSTEEGSSNDVTAYEHASYNIASPIGNDKDLSIKDNKSRSIQDAYKKGANKTKQNLSSSHLPSGNQKIEARCRSRQSERSDESKDLHREENTKAMEKYLLYLKSNNPLSLNQAANDGKVEKTDLRKASRPPTPHRTFQLHKVSSTAPRFSGHVRESNQPTGGTQETPKLHNKTDRDARLEQLLQRRPRSRQSLTNERKEAIIDPSGGDFQETPAFSSTNSVDSNVGEYNNKLNISDIIDQPKSETSDIKITRQVPASSKPTNKWSALPGRNIAAKRLPNTTPIRPQSARAHETSDKKQTKQFTALLRARSSSASKTQVPVTAKKQSSLLSSPKSVDSTRRNSLNGVRSNERAQKQLKLDSSEIGKYILTEDEIADNDLVPPHLRERKSRDLSEQLSLALSSSDDSQNARLGGSHFNKISDAPLGKCMPEKIDIMDPQWLEEDATTDSKGVFSGGEMTYQKSNPLDGKRVEESHRQLFLQGKRRSTNTCDKFSMLDYPTDDLMRRRTTNIQGFKHHSAHVSSLAHVENLSNLSNSPTPKEAKGTKEGHNLTPTLVQNERKTGYFTRDGRERRILEHFRGTPEPFRCNIRGDNLHGTYESTMDKHGHTPTYMMNKPVEPGKGSPSKKAVFQKVAMQNPSFLREHTRDKKGYVATEQITPQEPLVRTRLPVHRMTSESVYNPFHFGNQHEKDDPYAEGESKTEKTSVASPQKKKRKSDQPKKSGKKKKKTDTAAEDNVQIRALLSPDSYAAKMPKLKSKEASKKEEETTEKMDRGEKSDTFDLPSRRRSSGDVSMKSHRSHRQPRHKKDSSHTSSYRKATSRDNSASSAFTEIRVSPRNVLNTPEKCSTRNISSPPASTAYYLLPVTRLTCQPTDRFPIKSHIPLIIQNSMAYRSKLDKLIQYRRLQNSMVEGGRRSRLPLSETFRKTLDSSVLEELALHCWQPTGDIYMDTQGLSPSASYQDVQSGSVPESLLGDGRLLSKEGLLDLTARLPYMKVGPLRFPHATYFLMAAACVTLGHVGVLMYHCGGDDYEYYCPDDDLECLMQRG